MTDYSVLKAMALAAQRTEDHYLTRSIAATDFANAASPATVLGLLDLVDSLRNAAAPLDPVNGDQLPAINSKVLIHLSSCDAWVEHTVVGYYAWEDLGANEYLHRVFIRVRDADGYLNARLLKDVRSAAATGKGAKP